MLSLRSCFIFIILVQGPMLFGQSRVFLQLGTGTEFGYNKSKLKEATSSIVNHDVKFDDKNFFLPAVDLMYVGADMAFAGISYNGVKRSWRAEGVTTNSSGKEQHYILTGNFNSYIGGKLGLGMYGLHLEDDDEKNFHGLFFYAEGGVAKNGLKIYNRGEEPMVFKEVNIAPLTFNEYKTTKGYFGLGLMWYYAIFCLDFDMKRFSNSYWYNQDGEVTPSLRNGGYWLYSVNAKVNFRLRNKEE